MNNAWRLKGKLLLINGELDDNVDPASTLQVVSELMKANKNFDQLYLPGKTHSLGGPFEMHKMNDYFVKNLMGVEPPSNVFVPLFWRMECYFGIGSMAFCGKLVTPPLAGFFIPSSFTAKSFGGGKPAICHCRRVGASRSLRNNGRASNLCKFPLSPKNGLGKVGNDCSKHP